MKLINYRCNNCKEEKEKLYKDKERIKEYLFCPNCKKRMNKFNFKSNKQRVFIFD